MAIITPAFLYTPLWLTIWLYGLFTKYERKTSFRLSAFFSLVLTSQLCDANGSTTLHPSWP